MSYMFFYATSFNQPVNQFVVTNVENFDYMFSYCLHFDQSINSWQTSSALSMAGMFAHSAFNHPVNNFVVDNVINFYETFYWSRFNQSLSSWVTKSALDMSRMFAYSPFNWPVGHFQVESVFYFSLMFASTPFNQPLTGWQTASAASMWGMFQDTPFNYPLDHFVVDGVQDFDHMFANSMFNQNISSWNVSSSIYFYNMFDGASSFDQNLCSWGALVPVNADVTRMFLGTSCPSKLDPHLFRSNHGPFCYDCRAKGSLQPTPSTSNASNTKSPVGTLFPTLQETTMPTLAVSTRCDSVPFILTVVSYQFILFRRKSCTIVSRTTPNYLSQSKTISWRATMLLRPMVPPLATGV